MIVRYCPECRHENTGRGKYCMFCGCDLRKVRPVSVRAGQAVNRAAEAREPEESGSRKTPGVLKVILIALIAVVAAVTGIVLLGNYGKSPAKDGRPALKAGMTFEEAASAMKRSGFEPEGDPGQRNGVVWQEYRSREVYGYTTQYSVLYVREGEEAEISLTHYYKDRKIGKEKESWDLLMLRSNLNARHGDPAYNDNGIYPFYYWLDGGCTYLLYSMGDQIVISEGWEKAEER